MKIYTKKGDSGNTSLVFGKIVAKSDIKIEAYGTVDELNSNVGLLAAQPINVFRKEIFNTIQNNLFVIGSNLACEKVENNLPQLMDSAVIELEELIDEMNMKLPDLKHFIIPGGNVSVSICHITRTICRRAERKVVDLMEQEKVDSVILKYLNRLSDYLFVLARLIGNEMSIDEIKWESK